MKRTIFVLGVAAVAMLMVLNPAIATMTQTNRSQQSGNNVVSTPNVVPGIYLSGPEQRKILSYALNQISDISIYHLVQAIIAKMDSIGYVTSYDIQQMVNSQPLAQPLGGVTSGQLVANNDGTSCPGSAWSHPDTLRVFGLG